MKRRLPCTYQIGTVVYLRMGEDRDTAGMITEVRFTADGGLVYRINWGRTSTDHYELEISTVKSFAEATTEN